MPQQQEPSTQDNALPAHRRASLARYVRDRGHATVSELATGFAVSMDTVRRDLDYLAERGILARTHGGAIRVDALATADTPFDNRTAVHRDAKEAIGVAAARLISDGETVLVNGGTTTLATVRALTGKLDLTVVTNNLRLPAEVPPNVAWDVYVLGGSLRLSSMVTIGPIGFPGTRGISADVALIGVGGVSVEHGLSTTKLEEAQMIREMIESSSRVVVVADSSKFGRSNFAHICGLAAVSTLVTERQADAALQNALKDADVEVVTAAGSHRPVA